MDSFLGFKKNLSQVTLSRSDASVTWLKDGNEITDDRITYGENGPERSLHIDQVRYPGDSGNYSCVVNSNPDEKCDVQLEVQKAFETFLTKLPETIEHIAGNDLILETEVSSEDADVQWLKVFSYKNKDL